MKKTYQKKFGILTTLCIICMISLSVIAVGGSPDKTIENEVESLEYTFQFAEPRFSQIQLNNQVYTRFSIPSTLLTGQTIGGPQIPAKPVSILLPQGTTYKNIEISYTEHKLVDTEAQNINLQINPIAPYQPPIPLGTNPPEKHLFNEHIYNNEMSFPGKLYDFAKIGYCRGYTILSFTLFPTDYNPSEGTLYYYPSVTININLQDCNSINSHYRGIPEDAAWVESLVINPEMTSTYTQQAFSETLYDGGLCSPTDNGGEGYDYVIITTEALFDFEATYTWDDLIAQKEAEGLHATKVTVEDIAACSDYWNASNSLFNDSAALIREFCRDAYADWNAQYILIGGDDDGENKIERREMDSAAESNVETDIYWTRLDGTFNDDEDNDWGEEGDGGFDFYSELFSGSIPCDEGIDVSNWLTKSFYYANSTETDYLENAAFFGGDTGWDAQGDTIMEFSAIKGTDDWMGPNPDGDGPYPEWLGFQYGFETWNEVNPGMEYNLSVKWTAEPPNPGWQGGSSSSAESGLRDAINNDQCTLISGVAHANSGMSLDVYSSTWESEYHNTKPFFLTDQGCHCGDMDASNDGVLHSMLFHSDTELAFACVYNTGYGWGNYDGTNGSSAVQMKSFWDYMFDVANNSQSVNNWQLGKAQEWARDLMGPMIDWDPDGDDGSYRNNIQSCLLFGDPAQLIKVPFVPDHDIRVSSLSIPSTIAHGEEQTVSAAVRNVGENLETNIIVNFSINGTVLDSTTISSLNSMENTIVSFPWNPDYGTYLVEIESQPIPNEYDLNNNNVNKTVDVIPAPAIEVSPLSLSFMVPTDATDTSLITISNLVSAEAALEYNISFAGDLGGSWLSATPESGTVPVGSADDVVITVDTSGLSEGEYSGDVIVSSNDLDDAEVVVSVGLTVVYGDDFAAVSVNSPVGSVPYGSYMVNATVQNMGFYDQSDVLVNCSIYEGFLDYFEDFEADDGEFTQAGGLWEYGSPVSGPSGAYSGSFCWGTNLDGAYVNDVDARLESGSIMIPNGVSATLSFYQWYDIENSYDGGNVKVSTDDGASWSVITPVGGYPDDSASGNNEGIPNEPCFTGSMTSWEQVSFDLTSFAGETVLIRWHFGSDGSVTDPGWFIDDVRVEGEYGSSAAVVDNTLVFSTTEVVSLVAYESVDVLFSPVWVAGGGNYTIQVSTMLADDEQGSNDVVSDVVFVTGPSLSFSPGGHDFGTMMNDTSDSTSFEIWNSGVGTLTYSLSESCDWVELSSYSGDSSGEHDTIMVDVDTTGLTAGQSYSCDVNISSDGGNGVFSISVFVVDEFTPVEDVNQSVFDRGFPVRHAVDGDWAGAQNFTPTVSVITSADLYLRSFGVPEFDLVVELREGGPEGTLLDSVTFTPGEVPGSWEWFSVDFVDTAVVSGVDYFVVVPPAPGGVSSSFGYEWGYALSDVYDGGSFWFTRDGGGLWRDLPSMYEFTFVTYGLL